MSTRIILSAEICGQNVELIKLIKTTKFAKIV